MGRLLITGGAGFIGSNLAANAQKKGWKVRILDDLSTGLKSISDKLNSMGIEVFIGDIRNEDLLHKAIEGCDLVVHLAAQVSVPISIKEPKETMSINVEGTSKVIEACISNGIERIVMASSAAVYGDTQSLPLDEEDAGQFLSPYAESKWINEKQISDARKNGLKATALRFFNVYGKGQRPDGAYAAVIPKFADMMVRGVIPRINGDGLHTRDFVHVDDVCNAIFSLLEGKWQAEKYHVYNVATQTKITLLDLISSINMALSKHKEEYQFITPVHGPERIGDIRHSMASIDRIRETLNWNPAVDFKDGIEDLVLERITMM